jgi:hypothetical protein
MKKIIVLTNTPEKENSLITCLRILFQKCEISLCPKDANAFKDEPLSPEKENKNFPKYY